MGFLFFAKNFDSRAISKAVLPNCLSGAALFLRDGASLNKHNAVKPPYTQKANEPEKYRFFHKTYLK